jgi:hypothetical protein
MTSRNVARIVSSIAENDARPSMQHAAMRELHDVCVDGKNDLGILSLVGTLAIKVLVRIIDTKLGWAEGRVGNQAAERQMHELACACLEMLAMGGAGLAGRVVEAGAVPVLVKWMQGMEGSFAPRCDAIVLNTFYSIITNIDMARTGQYGLFECAIPALVRSMEPTLHFLHARAAKVFQRVAGVDQVLAYKSAGGRPLQAMVMLLRSDSDDVVSLILHTLHRFCSGHRQDMGIEVLDADVIPDLVRIVGTSSEHCWLALMVMEALVTYEPTSLLAPLLRCALADKGAIPSLLKVAFPPVAPVASVAIIARKVLRHMCVISSIRDGVRAEVARGAVTPSAADLRAIVDGCGAWDIIGF